MTVIIAYVIAGISATAFVTLWFTISYHKLSLKYREAEEAAEQVKMHYAIYRQDRESLNVKTVKRILDTSRMIYRESVNDYNRVYANPIYRLPGFMLGFRFMKEKEP